jgi:hypothetical protein
MPHNFWTLKNGTYVIQDKQTWKDMFLVGGFAAPLCWFKVSSPARFIRTGKKKKTISLGAGLRYQRR